MLLSRIDFPCDDEEEEEAYRGTRYVTLSYDRNVNITVPEGNFLERNFSAYKDKKVFEFFRRYKKVLKTEPGSQNTPIKDKEERQIFEQFHSDYFLVRDAKPDVKAILKKQQSDLDATLYNDRILADKKLKDASAQELQTIAMNPKIRRKRFWFFF